MSAVGGVIDFSASEGDPGGHFSSSLDALDQALAWLGPDGSYRLFNASVAMLYKPFHTTRDSSLDRQPLESNDLLIIFNGRLDNLNWLRVTLGLVASATQTEVVQHAYRRWGCECFGYLIGDFAAAVWDRANRRLILARDPIGTRSLYYAYHDGRACWASMPDAVLAALGKSLEVNRRYVAAYLSFDNNPFLSPFRHVTPVPPGHFVAINAERVTTVRFWNIRDYVRGQKTMGDEEYEEQFRSLFFSSVRNRLCADKPVAAQLSGGLDSSSIVCAADRLVGSSRELTTKLITVSHVFDRGWKSDEREFIRIVEADRGVAGIHLREDDAPILGCWPDPEFVSFPNPVFFTGAHIIQVLEAMRSEGARVLLSGHGGDHVLMSGEHVPLELADFLRRGRVTTLIGRLLSWSRATEIPVPELLWTAAVRPCIRSSIDPQPIRTPRWLHDKLRHEIGDDTRSRTGWKELEGLPPSKKAFCATVEEGIGIVAAGHTGLYTTLGRIEARFPCLDRLLIEFLTAVPTQQLYRPAETRSLQRRALRGVLPAKIAQRTSKGMPEHAITIAIGIRYEFLRNLILNSVACGNQYVDQEKMVALLEGARHGVGTSITGLVRFVSLEFWLRAIERCPPRMPEPISVAASTNRLNLF